MTAPLLQLTNPQYWRKILDYKNIEYKKVSNLNQVKGFDSYNRLIDINQIFSSLPKGDIIDRTNDTSSPFKYNVIRPWVVPDKSITLDQAMLSRVEYFLNQPQQLNLCWSGGIDSTAIVAAFLQHTNDLSKLRLLYSPFSLYEHPEFFEYITKNYPALECLDISGDIYLKMHFDGIMITGHGGDEFTASLDKSFVDSVGIENLNQSWRDYFFKQSGNLDFVNFCEHWFSLSGRPIDTLLQARWWFYAIGKSQTYAVMDHTLLLNQPGNSLSDTQAFFDCKEFEAFVWHNIDNIVDPTKGYYSYKQFLKDYTYQFDHNQDYRDHAEKNNSAQLIIYNLKKTAMLDLRYIAILSNNTTIRTDNLPLLSKMEFDLKYGTSLDYLFNCLPNA